MDHECGVHQADREPDQNTDPLTEEHRQQAEPAGHHQDDDETAVHDRVGPGPPVHAPVVQGLRSDGVPEGEQAEERRERDLVRGVVVAQIHEEHRRDHHGEVAHQARWWLQRAVLEHLPGDPPHEFGS
jgi:hypothetical protein